MSTYVENGTQNGIGAPTCSEIRSHFWRGKTGSQISNLVGESERTVYYHLKGKCQCDSWARPVDYNPYIADASGCAMCDARFPELHELRRHSREAHYGD